MKRAENGAPKPAKRRDEGGETSGVLSQEERAAVKEHIELICSTFGYVRPMS